MSEEVGMWERKIGFSSFMEEIGNKYEMTGSEREK